MIAGVIQVSSTNANHDKESKKELSPVEETRTLRSVCKIREQYDTIYLHCFLWTLLLSNERLRLGVIRTLHTTSYHSTDILRDGSYLSVTTSFIGVSIAASHPQFKFRVMH
jgi:hypothetical protein